MLFFHSILEIFSWEELLTHYLSMAHMILLCIPTHIVDNPVCILSLYLFCSVQPQETKRVSEFPVIRKCLTFFFFSHNFLCKTGTMSRDVGLTRTTANSVIMFFLYIKIISCVVKVRFYERFFTPSFIFSMEQNSWVTALLRCDKMAYGIITSVLLTEVHGVL